MAVNSKQKGGRGEREVVDMLKEYWKDDTFMRAPDSGALSTMLEYSGAPMDIVGRLAGDVLAPSNFPFCVESKFYAEIDLWAVIRNPKNCEIKQWWEQCAKDAKRGNKIPLLTIKENRKKRYVALSLKDIESLQRKATPDNMLDFDAGYLDTTFVNENGGTHIRIFLWEDFVRLFPKERIT